MSKQNSSLPFTPLIVVGAGRSGTNALRNALCALPGFSTWPCDEINPIWRHGNVFFPNDEIPESAARPSVKRFIRKAFHQIWSERGRPRYVVEKTCANSLRIPFVNAVLPEAKFVYIVRNGLEVVASANKRWRGELEFAGLPYFLAKVRYTPLFDLPLYGWSFLKNRAAMVMGRREHLSVWGPRAAGLENHMHDSLDALCARQWAACVNQSDTAFASLDPRRVFKLCYEDLISDPKQTLKDILAFLDVQADTETIALAAGSIRQKPAKKDSQLNEKLGKQVLGLMDEPLRRHEYGV
jgi:hypothetical protein